MANFLLLFTLGLISRVIPHPANFTPLGAILAYGSNRKGYKWAMILGLLIMVTSDVILGFSFSTPFVYLGFASYAVLPKILSKKIGLIPTTILSSLVFFLISNLGVWLGPWYEHSWSGLIKCFTLAIPFYKNMLLADAVFLTALLLIEKIKIKKTLNKEVACLRS